MPNEYVLQRISYCDSSREQEQAATLPRPPTKETIELRKWDKKIRSLQEIVDEPDYHDSQEAFPVEADDQGVWICLHSLAIVLLWFLELRTESEKDNGRDDCDSETDAPGDSEVLFGSYENHDHGNESTNCETHVDHEVRGEDEPSVAVATLELPSTFSSSHASSRIFSSNANTDQETVCGESCKHASQGPVGAI